MDDIVIVRLDGEIDVSSKAELRTQLEPLAGSKTAIVDLRTVTYMDSSALTEILLVRRRREQHTELPANSMSLIVGDSPVRRILILGGLDKVFPIHATVEEASARG